MTMAATRHLAGFSSEEQSIIGRTCITNSNERTSTVKRNIKSFSTIAVQTCIRSRLEIKTIRIIENAAYSY